MHRKIKHEVYRREAEKGNVPEAIEAAFETSISAEPIVALEV